MKSTGEVMGTAGSFGKAYQKAQMCVDKPIPLEGTAVVDLPVLGFEEHLEVLDFGDFESTEAVKQAVRDGDVDVVISRNREVLEVCVEETVTYFSTIESAEAALEAVNAADQPMAVQGIADRPKTQRRWGE
jgi:carbamoyl-phosphate synthase large subunit